MLIRNTTYTASRDGGEGSRFLTTTFYDGQGMMVRADSGYTSIDDMDGTTICVLSGTTTELNLATAASEAGISYTPLTFTERRPDPGGVHRRAVPGLDVRQVAARRRPVGVPA